MTWYTLAIISALFSAAAAIFEKKALLKDSALNFSTLLATVNLALSLPLFYFNQAISITDPRLLVLLFKTFFGALAFLFIMKGLKNLQISGALPLLVLTPGLVAIAEYFFINDTITKIETYGIILMLIGTYALQIDNTKGFFHPITVFIKTKGRLYLVAALLIFTATSIIDKLLLSEYKLNPKTFFAWQHLFLFIHFTIFALIIRLSKGKLDLRKSCKLSWKWILLVSVFTIIYRYSQIEAVKAGKVSLVLTIKRTSVFFAAIIGGTIFKDTSLLRKAIAIIIMLTGAALILITF